MPIKPALEIIAVLVALVCFAIAVKAVVESLRANRAAKRKSLQSAAGESVTRKPMSRAS